jgi:hypothetical protein
VEDSEGEEAAEVVAAVEVVEAVPQEDLPDAHQVVRRAAPDPEALLLPPARVRQVVLGLVVPFHPVMDPPGRRQLSRSLGSLDQMGYPLNPIIPVRVRVPVFWGDFVAVGSWDPLPAGTAGVTVAVPGYPPVETIPSTRWSLPWQRGRSREPLVVVSPSGSKLVGLVGAYWRVMVIKFVRGSGRLLSVQRLAALSLARPQPENF